MVPLVVYFGFVGQKDFFRLTYVLVGAFIQSAGFLVFCAWVHLLGHQLIHLNVIPVRTFSGKMTKLLTCKTRSVNESVRVRVCDGRVGRFRFALRARWITAV